MIKESSNKRNMLPGVILVAFIAAVATFFVFLNIEKNALKAFEKVPVWSAGSDLVKGLEITEKSLAECLVRVEVDKNRVPAEMVEDPMKLVGKRTVFSIPEGTILTPGMFTDEEAYRSGMYQPVIAGCKGDDLFQLVSGVLRKGDLVHIYTVNDELDETYMLWENIMVYQVFDTAGNSISNEDTITPAARVNLLLEEGYTEQFYNELNSGTLRLVKVWK